MNIIYVLLTISILVAIVFFIAFILSVKSGQYDDTYTPSVRMLFEDEVIKDPSDTSTTVSDRVSQKTTIQLNTKDNSL